MLHLCRIGIRFLDSGVGNDETQNFSSNCSRASLADRCRGLQSRPISGLVQSRQLGQKLKQSLFHSLALDDSLDASQHPSTGDTQDEFTLGSRTHPDSDAEVDDDHETKGPLRGRSESGTEGEID